MSDGNINILVNIFTAVVLAALCFWLGANKVLDTDWIWYIGGIGLLCLGILPIVAKKVAKIL